MGEMGSRAGGEREGEVPGGGCTGPGRSNGRSRVRVVETGGMRYTAGRVGGVRAGRWESRGGGDAGGRAGWTRRGGERGPEAVGRRRRGARGGAADGEGMRDRSSSRIRASPMACGSVGVPPPSIRVTRHQPAIHRMATETVAEGHVGRTDAVRESRDCARGGGRRRGGARCEWGASRSGAAGVEADGRGRVQRGQTIARVEWRWGRRRRTTGQGARPDARNGARLRSSRHGPCPARRSGRASSGRAYRLLSCGGGPAGAQHGCSASRGLDRGRASAPLRLLPRTSGPRLSRCGGRLWARGPEPADAIHGGWVRVGWGRRGEAGLGPGSLAPRLGTAMAQGVAQWA